MERIGFTDLGNAAVGMLLVLTDGELNFFLRKKGIQAAEGFVFLLDEELSSENVIQSLTENVEAIEVRNLKKNRRDILNYQFAVHKYVKYDKEEELYGFLHSNHLTAVLVEGIVPEALQEMAPILRISKERYAAVSTEIFRETFRSLREYIRTNPELVSKDLERMKSSEWMRYTTKPSLMFTGLWAAAGVYLDFFRDLHSESETESEMKRVAVEIERISNEEYECKEGVEAAEAIRNTLLNYFDDQEGWTIASINQVDGKIQKALEEANAVLYDRDFYYISDELFRKSCKKLLDMISLIEIKKILKKEDFLCCNAAENNFTVKKMFTNVYGAVCRERFVKIRKDFLVLEDGLYLEDRKGETV